MIENKTMYIHTFKYKNREPTKPLCVYASMIMHAVFLLVSQLKQIKDSFSGIKCIICTHIYVSKRN